MLLSNFDQCIHLVIFYKRSIAASNNLTFWDIIELLVRHDDNLNKKGLTPVEYRNQSLKIFNQSTQFVSNRLNEILSY